MAQRACEDIKREKKGAHTVTQGWGKMWGVGMEVGWGLG